MSNIDKQWLQQKIADMEEHRDLFPGDLDDDHGSVLAALRIALASLEAEPVAWRNKDSGHCGTVLIQGKSPIDCGYEPLYLAPPAPVSVPDENGLLPCPCCGGRAEFDYDDDNLNWISCNVCGISTDTAYHTDVDARDRLRDVWNLRAAMLQGAAGNSPAIPDGWVLVPVEPTAEMISSGIAAHYERSQIQIHDRPAPGPMECAYVAMLAAAPQQELKP